LLTRGVGIGGACAEWFNACAMSLGLICGAAATACAGSCVPCLRQVKERGEFSKKCENSPKWGMRVGAGARRICGKTSVFWIQRQLKSM